MCRRSLVALLLLYVVSTPLRAANYTNEFTVVDVGFSANSNSIYLRVDETFPHGCVVPQNIKTFLWGNDHAFRSEIFTLALTALTTGKKLTIHYSDDPTTCVNNHPSSWAFYIKK